MNGFADGKDEGALRTIGEVSSGEREHDAGTGADGEAGNVAGGGLGPVFLRHAVADGFDADHVGAGKAQALDATEDQGAGVAAVGKQCEAAETNHVGDSAPEQDAACINAVQPPGFGTGQAPHLDELRQQSGGRVHPQQVQAEERAHDPDEGGGVHSLHFHPE